MGHNSISITMEEVTAYTYNYIGHNSIGRSYIGNGYIGHKYLGTVVGDWATTIEAITMEAMEALWSGAGLKRGRPGAGCVDVWPDNDKPEDHRRPS